MSDPSPFRVEAKTTDGRSFYSWHSTKAEAKSSAKDIRGRYPYGNRVKVQTRGIDYN